MLRSPKRAVRLVAVTVAAAAALGAWPSGAAPSEPVAVPAADVATLVERLLDAHGGREALAACAGFRARGRVLSVAGGVHAGLRLTVALDGRLRDETVWPDRTEVDILAGPLAWTGGPERQRPAGAEIARSLRLEYARWAALFELARVPPDELAADGASAEGWLRVRREHGGSATVVEIDPESERLRRVRSLARDGDAELEFVAELADWRDVDGLVLPFRITTRVAGRIASETVLDRIDLEDDFPPGTFAPGGIAGDL